MTKTGFIFVDSSLELVPKKIIHDNLIKKNARKRNKKPSEIILDSSYHYKAIHKISNQHKRGRPDIIHFCLLNILGSRLVKENFDLIEIYIHTINDTIISVNPEVNLPRNYNRFIGLMEKLLIEGEIKSKNQTLLNVQKESSINDVLNRYSFDNRILLTKKGNLVKLPEFFDEFTEKKILIAIGAYPFGNIAKNMQKKFGKKIAIYQKSLDAWIVVNEVVIARNQYLI